MHYYIVGGEDKKKTYGFCHLIKSSRSITIEEVSSLINSYIDDYINNSKKSNRKKWLFVSCTFKPVYDDEVITDLQEVFEDFFESDDWSKDEFICIDNVALKEQKNNNNSTVKVQKP